MFTVSLLSLQNVYDYDTLSVLSFCSHINPDHLPNAPSEVADSLSLTSVKEGKITQKDPFDYEKWGLQQ